MRHYSPASRLCCVRSPFPPLHLSRGSKMKNLPPALIALRDKLDIQLWSALAIGVASVTAITMVVASLGRGPPPVQAGSRKSDKAELLKDIGPRTIPIQRMEPEPEPAQPESWKDTLVQIPLPAKPKGPDPDIWPVNSPPPKPAAKLDKAEQLCAKHNMRKVWINSKQWRCRKR